MEAQNVSRNVPTSALGDSAYIKLVFSNNIFSGLLMVPQLSASAYKRRINAALSNISINLSSTFRDMVSDLQSDEIFNVYGFCCAKIANSGFMKLADDSIDNIRERFGHFSVGRALMLSDTELSAFNPIADHTLHFEPYR